MRKLIAKQLVLTLNDLIKRTKVRSYLRFYEQLYHSSQSCVEQLQFNKLKKLLLHAYKNVPFYRESFDSVGFKPESFNELADVTKIPYLTRVDIQNNIYKLTAVNHSLQKAFRGTSSGSTGQPVIYYHDLQSKSAGWASLYYFWKRAGWDFGFKGMHIWGNPNTVNVQWQRVPSIVKSYLQNIQRFPAYRLTQANDFDKLISILKKNNFDYIDGYTNAIYLLAKKMADSGIGISQMRCVLTTGETLHDYQREIIEKVLGPVCDIYGCGEIMGICSQTKADSCYAIHNPHVMVEFDKDQEKADSVFPLIITDLDNYIMPLIRYKNGDMARLKAVNRNQFPLQYLDKIEGRISDVVVLPSGGNLVVPSFFGSKLLRLVKGIRQYQVEKVNSGKILIKLVTDSKLTQEDMNTLNRSVDEYIHNAIDWEIIFVDKIEADKSGKYKLIIDKTKL